MPTVGLFSRVDLREALTKKKKVQQRDIDRRVASELSSSAANALVQNQVAPYIQDDASFLVVGLQADSDKIPLTGKIHQICYELDSYDIPYALDALIRTKRLPRTDATILAAALGQNVRDMVSKLRPRVVLALAAEAAKALIPELNGGVEALRGQAYPAKVGDHVFWLVITHDPRDIVEDKYGRLPPWAEAIPHDVKLAATLWRKSKPPKTPYIRLTHEELRAFGTYEVRPFERVRALRKFAKTAGQVIALDFENTPLHPWDSPDARITAIGVSDGKQTLSVPYEHYTLLGEQDFEALQEAFLETITGREVICHNVLHELYWMFWKFGKAAVRLPRAWHCTQVGAFTNFVRAAPKNEDDEEPGVAGTSLNDQTLLHFGFPIKTLSPENAWNEKAVSIQEHCNYNGLDAHFDKPLFDVQQELLEKKGLKHVYDFRILRSIYLAQSTVRGMPLDGEQVDAFWDEYSSSEQAAEQELKEHPDIIKYTKQFGQFEWSKNEHVGRLLNKICGINTGVTASGKTATSKDILLAHAGDHPIVKKIIQAREIQKQKKTYLDRLRPHVEGTYVGVDGKLHPQRIPTRPVTGRHSCVEPNAQNYAARGPAKRIRRIVKAKPGWSLVSIDLGQIEARVICMASKDKTFRKSLYDKDLDVHKDWAKKLSIFDYRWHVYGDQDIQIEDVDAQFAEVSDAEDFDYVCLMNRHRTDFKGLRGIVKNKKVFPAFFGAGPNKVSQGMLMDFELVKYIMHNHFWVEFAGVHTWQKQIEKFYKKNFYVEALTGFRIHGPLTYNNIINYPIQSTASEILQAGAGRITEEAHERNLPWMVPIIDIHDDLTWHLPTECVEWHLETVLPILLHPDFDFIDVPLTCEAKWGPSWDKLEEIATYSSEQKNIKVQLTHAH